MDDLRHFEEHTFVTLSHTLYKRTRQCSLLIDFEFLMQRHNGDKTSTQHSPIALRQISFVSVALYYRDGTTVLS